MFQRMPCVATLCCLPWRGRGPLWTLTADTRRPWYNELSFRERTYSTVFWICFLLSRNHTTCVSWTSRIPRKKFPLISWSSKAKYTRETCNWITAAVPRLFLAHLKEPMDGPVSVHTVEHSTCAFEMAKPFYGRAHMKLDWQCWHLGCRCEIR
jgi:hypothetical protein